jgi:hypothetical protein
MAMLDSVDFVCNAACTAVTPAQDVAARAALLGSNTLSAALATWGSQQNSLNASRRALAARRLSSPNSFSKGAREAANQPVSEASAAVASGGGVQVQGRVSAALRLCSFEDNNVASGLGAALASALQCNASTVSLGRAVQRARKRKRRGVYAWQLAKLA